MTDKPTVSPPPSASTQVAASAVMPLPQSCSSTDLDKALGLPPFEEYRRKYDGKPPARR